MDPSGHESVGALWTVEAVSLDTSVANTKNTTNMTGRCDRESKGPILGILHMEEIL